MTTAFSAYGPNWMARLDQNRRRGERMSSYTELVTNEDEGARRGWLKDLLEKCELMD